MKDHLRLSIASFLALIAFVLYSCSSVSDIQVDNTNFKNATISEKQNLIFHFNKKIFPDSLVTGKWDTTQYIEFQPRVLGSFKWNSADELMFSPRVGFQPSTEYKAILTSKLLDKYNGKSGGKFMEDASLHFNTEMLKVNNAGTQWTRSNAQVMMQMNLDFNYNVDVNATASKLSITSNGTPVNFSVVNGGLSKTISIQFLPTNSSGQNTAVEVRLQNGIPIAGTKNVSARDTSFNVDIPSRDRLEISSLDAQHDGLQGVIDIALSQPISSENIKNYITLKPAVAFEAVTSDKGITITSENFNAAETYQLTISKKLTGDYGGHMLSNYSADIKFGKLEPTLSFVNQKGFYLSDKGYKNLAIKMVQVPKVRVSVVKVYENNIMQLFKKGTRYGYSYDEATDEYGGSYDYYDTEDIGDTVYTKTYDVDKLPSKSSMHFLNLDFSDKLKGYNGVYVITVASTEQKWVQESKILSLSDIGLIAKKENNKVFVFANSIKSATPLAGTKVSFISTTNQVVYTKETDNEGVAVFDNIEKDAPGFDIGMVSAKMGEEYSFLLFNNTQIETSRFDVGGRVSNKTGLNAWIYAERNLYRPGETIHASTIVRDEKWQVPGEMPVKLRLLMPNGKEMSVKKLVLNEQGSTETAFDVPKAALTGVYVLEVYSGNDVLLNSYDFNIEDFVPDRIKSDLKINKNDFAVGENLFSLLQADNLFGTPAINRNVEWELGIEKGVFRPKGFDDFDFQVVKEFDFKSVLRTGKTDAKGHLEEHYTINNDLAFSGFLNGNIRATVFDETGRPVHRFVQFNIWSQPTFIGIKRFNDYVSTKRPLAINIVAVNKEGRLQSQNATVTILKKEWQNIIQESGGRYKYVSQWTDKTVSIQKISINGENTNYSFAPPESGEYEIRVSTDNSQSYVSEKFYAYSWGDTQYASFEVNNEGNVTIKSDKEKYKIGENIDLLFTTPFEGRMLVTVERNNVLEHYFVQTNNKTASLQLKVMDAYLPNVYIAATLFRPMNGDNMPLTVAHGYSNISVEDQGNKLPVNVTMTEKTRSKTKQNIHVTTAPNAYVTIAAVDEGILQVRNYESPDAYNYFYQKVALGVHSYDVYPFLLPEYNIGQSSSGGDGAASQMKSRVNPLFVNRIKNVSFWSGILKADGGGNVHYYIDVPQFSGKLRVMVVAYKNKAFGSFDNGMMVADPVIISTALPRFLSPGDKAKMPITVTNTTGKSLNATVEITSNGAVNIPNTKTSIITIEPNNEKRVVFELTAANQIGAGNVLVKVKAGNETFTNETDISVRPAASLQKQYSSGIIKAGNSEAIDLNNKFIQGSMQGSLLVSRSPLVQYSKNLNYLVQYPYGCVEQTVSSVFPQLYYGDLVAALNNKKINTKESNYNVQQAILKLQSMQLPDGSLSYWPGGGCSSWWGSVYAAHFIQEAMKAGFDVNPSFNNKLLGFLKAKLKKRETSTLYYNGNMQRVIIAKEVPYSLYVLAIAKQPQTSLMNYYKANTGALSLDGRYLLAASFLITGNKEQGKQIMPSAFKDERSFTEFGGSFYSYVRDMGVSLNAMLDSDPNNAQIGELSRTLTEQMNKQYSLNTQENAFAILAFGKIAKRSMAENGHASVYFDQNKIADITTTPWSNDLANMASKSIKVTADKGAFYYFKELSGISIDGSIKEGDRHLKVRRTFYDRNGNVLTGNTFKQNDLIVIKLTLEGEQGLYMDNIVVTDMLPAGFEIENTRLLDLPNVKWVTDKNSNTPDYMDVRDDRLNLFTNIKGDAQNFYYMVRAVSAGVYKLGPVQADAMYNGAYYSVNGSGTVTISE